MSRFDITSTYYNIVTHVAASTKETYVTAQGVCVAAHLLQKPIANSGNAVKHVACLRMPKTHHEVLSFGLNAAIMN